MVPPPTTILNRSGQATKYQNGQNWTTQIIQTIWAEWTTLWEMRNKDVHGHDTITRNKIRCERLTAELQELYSKREFMLPEHQHLLFDNITDHLEKPLDTIENWITIYTPTILHSIQQAEERATINTRPLTSFFPKRQRNKKQQPISRSTTLAKQKSKNSITKRINATRRRASHNLRQQQKKFRTFFTHNSISSSASRHPKPLTPKTTPRFVKSATTVVSKAKRIVFINSFLHRAAFSQPSCASS